MVLFLSCSGLCRIFPPLSAQVEQAQAFTENPTEAERAPLKYAFLNFLDPRRYDLIRLLKPANAPQRGSLGPESQSHAVSLRFWPQRGQSPLQSGWHSVRAGRDRSTCSRSTSSSARPPFS